MDEQLVQVFDNEPVAGSYLAEIPKTFSNKIHQRRFGRLNFINASMILFGVFILPYALVYGLLIYSIYDYQTVLTVVSGILMVAIGIAMLFFNIRALILRLHDLNLAGPWALVVIFGPLIFNIIAAVCLATYNDALMVVGGLLYFLTLLASLVMTILLLALPGTKGENKFGVPTKQGSIAGLVIMLVLIGLGILSSIAFFAVFMSSMRYLSW